MPYAEMYICCDITGHLLPNRVFIHDVKGERVEAHGQMQSVFLAPERIQVFPDGGGSGRDTEHMIYRTLHCASCGMEPICVRLIRAFEPELESA